MPEILTVGHSAHPIEHFVALLRRQGVTVVADVRSHPASRWAPQFGKARIEASLDEHGIRYVFLGRELGARSPDPGCYVDGKVQYARLAATDAFQAGLARVLAEAEHERLALLCTEKDPLDCHRTVLVARRLAERGARLAHLHADGSVESHDDAMDRLVQRLGLQPSLFADREVLVAEALEVQEARIAYVDPALAARGEGSA